MESCRGIVDREPDNAPARIELSRLLASEATFEAAVGRASEAVRLAPDDPRAGEQLASIVADAGDAARLGPLPESLAARFPGRPDAEYYRASALFLAGRTEKALAAARHVVDGHPGRARAQNLVGAACATPGRRDCIARRSRRRYARTSATPPPTSTSASSRSRSEIRGMPRITSPRR